MNKVSSFFAILCAIFLVSCGGGSPQGIVEEYYSLMKQGNFEKVAEVTVDHFWKTERLDKAQIDNHREEVVSQVVEVLLIEKEKDRLPKDFTIVDVTTETGKTLIKVREMYSDNDFDRLYTFVKEDGKWCAVEKEFISEAGRADAWYRIKVDGAKVTLYTAPDIGAEVGGHINIKTHIKGNPSAGSFKVQKTDIEGWGSVIKDIWEYPEWNNGSGIYKGDITYYVNRAELTENAKPER